MFPAEVAPGRWWGAFNKKLLETYWIAPKRPPVRIDQLDRLYELNDYFGTWQQFSYLDAAGAEVRVAVPKVQWFDPAKDYLLHGCLEARASVYAKRTRPSLADYPELEAKWLELEVKSALVADDVYETETGGVAYRFCAKVAYEKMFEDIDAAKIDGFDKYSLKQSMPKPRTALEAAGVAVGAFTGYRVREF